VAYPLGRAMRTECFRPVTVLGDLGLPTIADPDLVRTAAAGGDRLLSRPRRKRVDNPAFPPHLLPYLGESGWFSVGPGARQSLNTNDFGMWILGGGGSENRKVNSPGAT
jgi:hypothetical protein